VTPAGAAQFHVSAFSRSEKSRGVIPPWRPEDVERELLGVRRQCARSIAEGRQPGIDDPTRSPLSTQGDSRDGLPGNFVACIGSETVQVASICAHHEDAGPRSIQRLMNTPSYHDGEGDELPVR
jgi:hypothetical protein